MTREKAVELVDDLIQAYLDYENFTERKTYREDYLRMKELVISQLVTPSPQEIDQ